MDSNYLDVERDIISETVSTTCAFYLEKEYSLLAG